MLLLRWLRVVVVGLVLAWLVGLAAVGPMPLLMAALEPWHAVAGTLVALGPVALAVVAPGAARSALLALAGSRPVPAEPAVVTAVAAAVRELGGTPPTCFVATTPLPRPVVLSGGRSTYLLATAEAYDDVPALARVVRADVRTGSARLLPLAAELPAALAAWDGAWWLVTAAVRPGRTSALDRLVLVVLLPLAVPVAVGRAVAWVLVQVGRLVVPGWFARVLAGAGDAAPGGVRHARDGGVRLGPGSTVGQMLATGAVEASGPSPARLGADLGEPSWWSYPRRAARARAEGPVVAAVRVVSAVLILWTGTFAGLGRLPAERVHWPWEPATVEATVTDVTADLRGREAILGRLGMDVASTYEATVRTPDGEVRLPAGTTPLEVGDAVRVVPATDREPARSLARSSVPDVLVMGLLFTLAALGLHRVAGGLAGLGEHRTVRVADWEQRGLTGRPRRGRRPREPLGARRG